MQAMKAKNENTFLNSLKTSGLGYDLGTPDLWYEATIGAVLRRPRARKPRCCVS